MATKFTASDDDTDVGEAAHDAFQKVENITYDIMRGMQENGDNQQPHHLYVVLTAMAAAAQVAAKIMSAPMDLDHEEFMEWSAKPAERTAVLAAALLMARCLLPTKDGFAFDFNSQNICAAIEATKAVSNNSDVSLLNRKMREAAARCAAPTHFFDNSRDEFGDLIPTVH